MFSSWITLAHSLSHQCKEAGSNNFLPQEINSKVKILQFIWSFVEISDHIFDTHISFIFVKFFDCKPLLEIFQNNLKNSVHKIN